VLSRRRVLEMGARIHWYLVFITMALLAFYILCLNYEVSSEYCAAISNFLKLFIMFTLVFGIWLFVYCLALFFKDKIFPVKPFFGTLVRIILVVLFDLGFSLINEFAGSSLVIL